MTLRYANTWSGIEAALSAVSPPSPTSIHREGAL